MKKITLLFWLFSCICFSQKTVDNLTYIPELEKSRAAQKITFKRNNNTSNYDINYHRLEWNVDPNVKEIAGSITTHYKAISNMTEIVFDLANNMTVSSVLQRGKPLSFSKKDDELIITLPKTQNKNSLDSLTVNYKGTPNGYFKISQHQDIPVLWTMAEPYGAKYWWPCKQDLTDKIDSIDVFIKTPTKYTAVSNGLLLSEKVSDNLKTTHWKHRYKIPAYLIAFSVTNYEKYSHHVSNGDFYIDNYVYPESKEIAVSKTPVTVEIMNLYGKLFEVYPFAKEKYGHAQFSGNGGMEHTTISFMKNFNRGLIAHELAHHWFGNKVTCGSWGDIWLNEGFASYLEGLTVEHLDGENAFVNWKRKTINYITYKTSGSVFCNDTTNVNRIFNSRLTYKKGAMVLHLLRYKLGDSVFFKAVKNYLKDPKLAYGYARTIDLKNHLEMASGKDLSEFFNDWFTGEGFPIYDIQYNLYGKSVEINVKQTQSHSSVSFFEIPLTFKLLGENGEEKLVRFDNTKNNEIFNYTCSFKVKNVIFDPNSDIIQRYSNETLSNKKYVLENNLTIYPNPTNNIITINSKSPINKISIYNNLGQFIDNLNLINHKISIKNYPKGVYFIKLFSEKGSITKTLLKR